MEALKAENEKDPAAKKQFEPRKIQNYRQGDIIFADFGDVGDFLGENMLRGIRPAVVIGSDFGSIYTANVQVVVGTHGEDKEPGNTRVMLPADHGLPRPTLIKCDLIQTIPKSRITNLVGTLINTEYFTRIQKCVMTTLGLDYSEPTKG